MNHANPSHRRWLVKRRRGLRRAALGLSALGILALSACGSAPAGGSPAASTSTVQASNTPLSQSSAKPSAPTSSAAASGQAVQPKPTVIKVAYGSPSAAFLPLFVAEKEGLFAKYGLAESSIIMATSATQDAALASNEIQINLSGAPTINSIDQGLPFVFTGAWLDTVIASIMAQPGYQDIDQLLHDPKATIAVNAPPALLNLCWRMVAQARSVPLKQLQLLNINAIPATIAALESHQASAICITEPNVSKLRSEGFKELLDVSTLKIPMLQVGPVVTKRWGSTHRQEIEDFYKATIVATYDLRRDRALGESAIRQYLKMDDPVAVKAAYDTFAPKFVQVPKFPFESVPEYFRLLETPIPSALDRSKYVDDSFVDQLQQSGFIQAAYAGKSPQ